MRFGQWLRRMGYAGTSVSGAVGLAVLAPHPGRLLTGAHPSEGSHRNHEVGALKRSGDCHPAVLFVDKEQIEAHRHHQGQRQKNACLGTVRKRSAFHCDNKAFMTTTPSQTQRMVRSPCPNVRLS